MSCAKPYKESEVKRRRAHTMRNNEVRTPFEIDRNRIIHSTAFRRLQGKSQVFGIGHSDFFRTRLTHSLEAAQIGKGIALQINSCSNDTIVDTDLVEAACLAHDIGHPPFGHTGEDVLKEKMKCYGGFEANAQNIRVLCRLEVLNINKDIGLNLTRATLDALLKYKKSYSEIDSKQTISSWKFYYDEDKDIIDWVLEDVPKNGVELSRTLECQIMDWADDIAYSTHDLEDGIKIGLINESLLNNNKFQDKIINKIINKYPNHKHDIDGIFNKINKSISDIFKSTTEHEKKAKRREMRANYIHEFITNVNIKEREGTNDNYPHRYRYKLDIEPETRIECDILKEIVWQAVIMDERIATLRRKAQHIVEELFDELTKFDKEDTYYLYPDDFREMLDKCSNDDKCKKRIACDFIAGMTDSYAIRFYNRIKGNDDNALMEII